jgi:hypothetical protein
LLILHHIASDGWSLGVLFRELSELYRAFATGKPSPLPELPIQYADYALWQRNWVRADLCTSELAYWRQQLNAAPPRLELPADRGRPFVSCPPGARHLRSELIEHRDIDRLFHQHALSSHAAFPGAYFS